MRIAAMDLGSNSFHLLVADAHPDRTFEAVARDKEMLRLGSLVAKAGAIGEPDATAAVETVRRFAALAASLGADETVAVATAALREAEDSAELVDRIEAETGVRVRVIGGAEEAALVFTAVRASVAFEPSPVLVADLGGGSLELAVGEPSGMRWAASLKLGVGRLTAELVEADPPSPADLRRLGAVVDAALAAVWEPVASAGPRQLVVSSGTFTTLVGLAAGGVGRPPPQRTNQLVVGGAALAAVAERVLGASSRERASWPGVDSRRADLLPAGVVVLGALVERLGLRAVTASEWALREGMVIDAIGRHLDVDWSGDPAVLRRESVLALCARCRWPEAHSRKVSRLALDLFDGTAGLHHLGPAERELLELGALCHDIGEHVSTEDHEHHSAYLIEHGRLRGFRPDEVAVLACLARFHRRGVPKESFAPFGALDEETRGRVTTLVALLQVADGLDRSHGGPVRAAAVYAGRPGEVEVVVEADGDIELELWGLRRKRPLFERVFATRLRVESGQLQLPLGAPGPARQR